MLLISAAGRMAAADNAVRPEGAGPVAFPVGVAVTRPASVSASPPTTQPASQPATQAASRPATAPGTQPRDPDLVPEAIESHKKRVQDSQDLTPQEKAAVLEIYDQALAELRRGDEWSAEAARYDEAIRQIPAQLEQARAKWALPVEDLRPHPPQGATLPDIEQLYREAEDLDRAARIEAATLRRELQVSRERPPQNLARQAEIRRIQDTLAEEVKAVAAGQTEADRARSVLVRARRRTLWRELRALDRQSAYDDARRELLTVQIDLANRYQDATSRALAAWGEILKERRAAEAARAAAAASRQSVAFKDRPELFEIAEQNRKLAARRVELQKMADSAPHPTLQRDAVAAQRRTLADNARNLKKWIETAGLNEAISSVLRRQRAQLPDVLQLERDVRRLEADIARAQAELIDLEDQRAALVDLDRRVDQVMRSLRQPVLPQEQLAVRAQIQELLRTQRTYLDDLIRDYNARTEAWFQIDQEQRALIDDVRGYAAYIDEHILWVRSTRPLRTEDLKQAAYALRWIVDPAGWVEAGRALAADMQVRTVGNLVAVLALAVMVRSRRKIRATLRQIDQTASQNQTYTFTQTLQTIGLTLWLVAPWPGLLGVVGWRLSAAATASDFVAALAAALNAVAGFLLGLLLVREICRPHGLGHTHFRWPAGSVQLLRDHLTWLMAAGLPLLFVLVLLERQPDVEYRDSLGRLAFIGCMAALAGFAWRVLRPRSPLVAEWLDRHRGGWPDRLRYVWYPLAVLVPVAFAAAAAMGYSYTAMQLGGRWVATAGLLVAVLSVRALLLRLMFVGWRRLAREAARRRPAGAVRSADAAPPREKVSPGPVDAETSARPAGQEPAIDLANVDAQTRRLVHVATVFALGAGLWVTWAGVLPALGVLDRVHLWSTTVDVSQTVANPDGTSSVRTVQKAVPITLGRLAWAVLILLGAVIAAGNIPGLVEIAFARLLPTEPGSRYAINALSRYVITILGLIVAFSTIGVGWSKVQWLAAAVTVGLGFGLQEIFANFVSGIIILFERPVRVGDVISVGPISGTVSKIRIRATTIVDWNRKELIVPNKQFITSQVVNWTLSDTVLRLVISVAVPHGADPQQVRSLLLRVARGHPRVLEKPAPSVFLLGFSRESMEFSLRVFVAGPEQILGVQDELHVAIDATLRQAGIEPVSSRSPG